MKIKLFSFLLVISSCITAQNFKGVAYLPSYRMAHVDDINYGLITHVMASFVNPDSKGNMSIPSDIDNFVTKVHSHNAKAIISIGGGGDYSWGNKVIIYENLLKTAQTRTDFIKKIMTYVRDHKVDGLDNDIEGNALALSTFNIFSQELGDSIHAAGLEYSAAIGVGGSWGLNYWKKETLEKLDLIMTMSYGGVGSWNWSTKDDGHAYEKMKSDMKYLTETSKIPKEKVLGGVPFYTVEFPNEAQPNYNSYTKTFCEIYNDPQFDKHDLLHKDTLTTKDGNTLYINSLETLKKKMDYCNEFGGGVMIWEAGQDCFDGSISLMDSMFAYAQEKSLGLNEIPDLNVSVSQNPSEGKLTIKSDLNDPLKYEIYSSRGETVLQGETKIINVSKLITGVYFIKVSYSEIKYKSLKFTIK
tara:strand:- start:2573 stop:3814 length:1242 start_codon:yes stop_codon:yes gene_type:complete